MKQIELLPKRAKAKFCDYLFLKPTIRKCSRPAVVTIHQAAYCPTHAEAASRMFGPGEPIYVTG
jgi:hypothetical protein